MEDRDPYALFDEWMTDAQAEEPNDPTAMALATADASGQPAVRMVLLKGLVSPQESAVQDDGPADGFIFYTNLDSHKGEQLIENPKASLCFHWKSLRRQVRVSGSVHQVSDETADAYFASRPLQSRIGAWASKQSHPLESRWALEKRVAEYTAKFALGSVPRPGNWSGFRVLPAEIEFWHDRPYRLHDRIVYTRQSGTSDGATTIPSWSWSRLYP